jgi:hypothetical protein
MVADLCLKAAGVHLLGIESTDGPQQCIKLAGTTAAVTQAAEAGRELAEKMGSTGLISILPAPLEVVRQLADPKPVYSPLLGLYDYRIPRENHMSTSDAIGLLETQGLVAALHAHDVPRALDSWVDLADSVEETRRMLCMWLHLLVLLADDPSREVQQTVRSLLKQLDASR